MKQLMFILAEVTSIAAFAANVEVPKCEKSETAVMFVGKSPENGKTVREQMKAERTRKEAEKAGCPVEKWAAMSVKERCAFRKAAREARARQD